MLGTEAHAIVTASSTKGGDGLSNALEEQEHGEDRVDPCRAATVYTTMERNLERVRRRLGRPLTLADKVLLGHLDDPERQDLDPGMS